MWWERKQRLSFRGRGTKNYCGLPSREQILEIHTFSIIWKSADDVSLGENCERNFSELGGSAIILSWRPADRIFAGGESSKCLVIHSCHGGVGELEAKTTGHEWWCQIVPRASWVIFGFSDSTRVILNEVIRVVILGMRAIRKVHQNATIVLA